MLKQKNKKPERPRLLGSRDVADILGISTRQITNLVESRMMPAPVRLGGSVRWDREVLMEWIEDGCPRIPHTSDEPMPSQE